MGGKWVERGEENIVGMGKALTCCEKTVFEKWKYGKYIERIFFIMERINYYNWKRLRIDVIMVKRIREWGEFIFTM